MANTKSAAKRARQIIRRTTTNRRVKNKVKRAMTKVDEILQSPDKSKSVETIRRAISTLDKAAKTGQIHRNKAARHKSRLARLLATSEKK